MLKWIYKIIPLQGIKGEDQTFRISLSKPCSELIQSIEKTGLLQPIIVQEFIQDRFRIISGFRRFEALQLLSQNTIPVLCLHGDATELELYEVAMSENLSQRRFNALEISLILNKLSDRFAVKREEIIGKYLGLLGLDRSSKIYEFYAPLIHLEPAWQQAILGEVVSIEFASLIAQQIPDARQSFIQLINTLHMGKNRQKEFWLIFSDICKKNKISIKQLIQQELEKILREEKLTPSQKTERIREVLWSLRYPYFIEVKKRFDELVKKAKFPPDIRIMPSAFFMDEKFNMNFEFTNELDYQKAVYFLNKLDEEKIIQKIVNVTSGNETR